MAKIKEVFLAIEAQLRKYNQVWTESASKRMYKSIFIKSKLLSYIDQFCQKVIDDVDDINMESNEILIKFLKRFKDECVQK